MEIPVYIFTGFLEAGKTKFIQETLEDARFNDGERTLLLLCEEGIEEFEMCIRDRPCCDDSAASALKFRKTRQRFPRRRAPL